MIVKLLNGELWDLEFDAPHQTLWDIFKRIWDLQKTEFENFEKVEEKEKEKKYFNHFVFENEEGKTITIGEFDPYAYGDYDNFVYQPKSYSRGTGFERRIDTSIFTVCHALAFPKKEKFLIYCAGKDDFRYIDVHSLRFMDRSRVDIETSLDYFKYPGRTLVKPHQFALIDVDSFRSYYPKSFQPGPNMFEDTCTKIEIFLSRRIRGFQPGYIDKSSRKHFDHKKILEYC